MSTSDPIPQPELERLPLAAALPLAATFTSGIAMAALLAAVMLAAKADRHPDRPIPRDFSELGDGMITPVDPADRGAVAAATNALRLPDAQRADVERQVLAGERKLGWIVLVDSIDPDGDVVAVEASGLVQHVALSKAWIPVAVPLEPASITITGVRDGGGGGITVAIGTRAGPIPLRVLAPGEQVQVVVQ